MTATLTMKEARHYIKSLTGVEPPISFIYEQHKKGRLHAKEEAIPTNEKHLFGRHTRYRYNKDDLLKIAKWFNEQKGDLLSLEEAYLLFREQHPQVSLQEFRYLVQVYNKPPVSAIMWKHSFFLKEDVLQASQAISEQEMQAYLRGLKPQQEDLLSTAEALKYLKEQGKDIKPNTFYVAVKRGLIPAAYTPPNGRKTGYKFSKDMLDRVNVREYRKNPPQVKHSKPVIIRSSKDMEKLVGEYGELIIASEALNIVERKLGRSGNRSTASKRLKEQVGPVAKSGRIHYYPRKAVEEIVVHPLHMGTANL